MSNLLSWLGKRKVRSIGCQSRYVIGLLKLNQTWFLIWKSWRLWANVEGVVSNWVCRFWPLSKQGFQSPLSEGEKCKLSLSVQDFQAQLTKCYQSSFKYKIKTIQRIYQEINKSIIPLTNWLKIVNIFACFYCVKVWPISGEMIDPRGVLTKSG